MHRDAVVKRGFHSGFDLARLGRWDREPGANPGTMAFLPRDLLGERALSGVVRRLYQHEAESFAWYLIYICICMDKDGRGKISTLSPHPLSSWFVDLGNCRSSKIELFNVGLLLPPFPLHHKIKPLTIDLYDYWRARHNRQSRANTSLLRERARDSKGLPQKSSAKRKRIL
jgi:hypothetical protein